MQVGQGVFSLSFQFTIARYAPQFAGFQQQDAQVSNTGVKACPCSLFQLAVHRVLQLSSPTPFSSLLCTGASCLSTGRTSRRLKQVCKTSTNCWWKQGPQNMYNMHTCVSCPIQVTLPSPLTRVQNKVYKELRDSDGRPDQEVANEVRGREGGGASTPVAI